MFQQIIWRWGKLKKSSTTVVGIFYFRKIWIKQVMQFNLNTLFKKKCETYSHVAIEKFNEHGNNVYMHYG